MEKKKRETEKHPTVEVLGCARLPGNQALEKIEQGKKEKDEHQDKK